MSTASSGESTSTPDPVDAELSLYINSGEFYPSLLEDIEGLRQSLRGASREVIAQKVGEYLASDNFITKRNRNPEHMAGPQGS